MEGRETGQNLHSRSFYDIMNPHGHSSSLHTSALPHESLQHPMHTHHGIQHLYPFGGRWSSFSPGNGTSSAEISTTSGGTTHSNATKHSSGSHAPPAVASAATTQTWWGAPSLHPGHSNSDLHSFPSVPWNPHEHHEHHEPLSSTRESHVSPYHSAHLRMSNGLIPSSRHSHSYHHPHGSQFQGGTLIHFPHSSSHQSSSNKNEQPWLSSAGDMSSHSMSSSPTDISQYHKDKHEKVMHNDPLLSSATEIKEQNQPKSSLSANSVGLFKEKEMPSLYGADVEIPLVRESTQEPKHKQKVYLSEKDNTSDMRAKEKSILNPESEFSIDRSKHSLHSMSSMIGSWQNDQDRKQIHGGHDTKCTKYNSYYRVAEVEHPTKVLEAKEDSHSKRSHFSGDKNYASFPYSVSSELEKSKPSHGVNNSKSYLHGADKHLSKQDPYHMHVPNPASPSQRPSAPSSLHSAPSSLHSERISRAQATQDWVNQHPALYTSSPEHLLKHDQRAKYSEETSYGSQFERKPDSLPSAFHQSPTKSTSVKSSSRVEKTAKREHHYESPLNSTLPRYSGMSKVSKPDSPKMHTKHQESHHSNAPRFHHSKHPFNVDFLSVSADSEKKHEIEEHSYKADYMNPSDRVSVIKGMPAIPGLKKDVSGPVMSEHVRKDVSSPRADILEAARMKKPASLLDTPLPPKKVAPVTPRDPQVVSSQTETSSRSSEDGSSSSEEDSEDEEEKEGATEEAGNQENGTENDVFINQDDSEDGSDEASEKESTASGSESDENESQSQSTQDQDPSDITSLTESTPEKRKASFEHGREIKRRKVVDENLLKVPLETGWRRQIRIRPAGNGDSIRGDVYYFAPCGKKIRTYPEVTKYIEKNGINDLNLENFSFSTKTTVGEFLESKQGSKFVALSEEEVLRRYNLEKERQVLRYERMSKKREKKKLRNEQSRRSQEAKQRKKIERQTALEEAKIVKQQSLKAVADQKKRKRENEKQFREMERIQKQEQIRIDKEMRARSLQQEKQQKQERMRIEKEVRQRAFHEARRSKKEALQHAKMEEAMQKAREREMKRQQTVILKQQEKERRKQHLMMIRALESQRKAEERERKKEEKRLEKRLLKQRKMEQRRYERSLARELKKPVDDLVINDGKPLPDFERVKGLNIPGEAYADLLMVEEFVYCFGHVLDIDPESDFPGMADLQAALLNESSNEDALFTACESLLSVALHDPGASAATTLGVSLQNVELNEGNVSEVLRLFILATNEQKPHELAELLTDKPIHSLSPVKKAAILAFLVNELLCSDRIYNEMENCLEHMSNLRRDKWNMEGRIRKLKADLKIKKTEAGTQKEPEDKSTSCKPKPKALAKKIANQDDEASNASMIKDEDDDDEDDDDDDDDDDKDDDDKDSDDEEADDDDAGEEDQEEDQEEEESDDTDDETEPTTAEEIEKRINRLEKKHSKYRHKLFTASHTLRGLSLGQDRYKRRYHILPHAGGVYLEGMESSEVPDVSSRENMEDEKAKQRTRTSSGNYISDSNATPTEENKKLSLQLPSPIAVPNNVDRSVIKSPMMRSPVLSPGITSPNHHAHAMNNVLDREHFMGPSEKTGLLSPRHAGLYSPTGFKENPSMKWFSLFPQKACDETSLTRSSIVMPTANKGRQIIAPNVRLLSQDRQFVNSLSNPNVVGHFGFQGQGASHPHDNLSGHYSMSNAMYPGHHDTNLPGMPYCNDLSRTSWPSSDVDIQKLMEQDPQKAAVLLDIQSLEPAPVPEDKCYGWWRMTDPDMVHKLLKTLNTRGIREKMLHKSLTRHTDYACSSCKKEKEAFEIDNQEEEEVKEPETLKSPKKEKQKSFKPLPPGKIEDKSFPQVAFSMDKALLMEVEELEEKMFSASLQNKTWRLSQKASSNVTYIKKESKLKSEDKPLELTKARILSLERGIERRYLKPPFRLEKHPNQSHVSKSNTDNSQAEGQPQSSDKDWRITPSLLLWRETVEGCTSSAQLVMCISMLKDCIAWERSIMKVFCIECRKGDNEELLLLCDQCDRGCHTYCCQPKLERIPDGDWFCRECIMIASGSDQCYGCQGSTGRRLKCEFCPRYYHLQCVDPPLQKTPRSPWACPVCKKVRQKNKRPPKRKKRPEDEFESLSAFDKFEIPSKASRSKKEKMNNRKQAMKHMSPCRLMLAEMERHECSWPFLVPVNGKQFPEYYQIIKNPMDFHTMKIKLRDFQYQSREEFASDARLVFRNCDIFNEDDSEVGQAGKRMLKFFDKRWVDVVKIELQDKRQESKYMAMESDKSDNYDNDDDDDGDGNGNDSSEIDTDSAEG